VGFNAATLRFPRGRPASRWNPDAQREHERKIRAALVPAGSLRAQAALSCIRNCRLPPAVVARADGDLRARASGEAQRVFDEARRSGLPAQAKAARQARAAAAGYQPDDLARARHLAETLPSRVRGEPREETDVAGRAVESEHRRLKYADKGLRADREEFIREAVAIMHQSLVPHSVSAQLARLARDYQEQRDRLLRVAVAGHRAALVVPDGFRGRRPPEGRPQPAGSAQASLGLGKESESA